MVIFVKRAKIFMLSENGVNLRCVVGVKPMPQDVPDWVKRTRDYTVGIADGSITDLTPPAAPKAPPPLELDGEEQQQEAQPVTTDQPQQAEGTQLEQPDQKKKKSEPRKPKGTITASIKN